MRRVPSWDIAIIGGGASGTLLAAHLLRQARAPLRVLLLERGGRVGRGLAYSTDNPRHLLNVPAGRMSAFPDDAEHFLRWARQGEPGTGAGDFVSRARYGEYLEAVLGEAVEEAGPGVHLTLRSAEVTGLTVEEGGARLRLGTGEQVLARRAVLALGNALPSDLPVRDGGLYASARYRRSPWVAGGLSHIGPDESVLVVGTGLTMVDAVLSLDARGHRAPILALSRHGLLPRVHRPSGPPVPGSTEALSLREAVRRLRAQVRRTREAGGDWRAVLDGLRPATVALWRGLTHAERRRFLRHVRAFWEVHRHRMAPEVGATIERLQREGRLRLLAGRVRGFGLEADGVAVRYRPRGTHEDAVLRVRHVINCTGSEGALTRGGHPLLGGLLDAGLARVDALGLGLAADEAGALLDAHGQPSAHLFTLGPLRRGELWETTAIPEIRGQAQALAAHLLREAAAERNASHFHEVEARQP